MKFDIIIPMGCYCASAQALKSVKKRSRSLPFDWVGPLSFDQAVRFLETGFEGFFEKEDLVKYEKDTKKNVGYVNTRNNLLFLHDFKEVAHFDEEYVQLREKYERRIKRIYQTIRDSKDILYLHVHTPDMMDRLPADEELQAALERLRKMYPEDFHFLPPVREDGKPFLSLLAGHRDFEHPDWDAESLLARYRKESEDFRQRKAPYKRYPRG